MPARVVLIVLDGVGIGALPDASAYGDEGGHSLAHTAAALGGLDVPHLARMGLGRIDAIAGVPVVDAPTGAYGRMAEVSAGKDTTTGHWELAGVVLEQPFPTYPDGFPPEVIRPFERRIGRRVLGNCVASGTRIIEALGPDHMKSGRPIVYTSADSVFQIAAHESVVSRDDLYRYCRVAREVLQGPHAVGRVIARPFTGGPGAFTRTAGRRDFSLEPPAPTILDRLVERGLSVRAVGKIADVFAGRGIDRAVPAHTNEESIARTIELIQDDHDQGLIFSNLVEFDQRWGHRNDVQGYGRALEAFDRSLPDIQAALGGDDLLVVTADHGCDPTTPSTDHSREYVPLLVQGADAKAGVDLGTRQSFADVAATLADLWSIGWDGPGTSFRRELW